MEDLIDAIEWELFRAPDCDVDRYPLVRATEKGNVRAYAVDTLDPMIVVVFGFEHFGGERKVVLIDIFTVPNADD